MTQHEKQFTQVVSDWKRWIVFFVCLVAPDFREARQALFAECVSSGLLPTGFQFQAVAEMTLNLCRR